MTSWDLVDRVNRALPSPIRKLMRGGRRLLRLTPSGAWRLALAQWELLRTRRMCRIRPVGSLVQVKEPVARSGDRLNIEEARTWALAVHRASDYGLFRPSCLIRSIALVRLLDRAGIRGAALRAGVKRRNDQFLAHAWVELGETVLTDPPDHIAQFEPWADLGIFEKP
jgi:hypothetical protein